MFVYCWPIIYNVAQPTYRKNPISTLIARKVRIHNTLIGRKIIIATLMNVLFCVLIRPM